VKRNAPPTSESPSCDHVTILPRQRNTSAQSHATLFLAQTMRAPHCRTHCSPFKWPKTLLQHSSFRLADGRSTTSPTLGLERPQPRPRYNTWFPFFVLFYSHPFVAQLYLLPHINTSCPASLRGVVQSKNIVPLSFPLSARVRSSHSHTFTLSHPHTHTHTLTHPHPHSPAGGRATNTRHIRPQAHRSLHRATLSRDATLVLFCCPLPFKLTGVDSASALQDPVYS